MNQLNESLLALAAAKRLRFVHWFPFYRKELAGALANNCSAVYQDYVAGSGYFNKGCALTVDCILGATRETTKANMASAAVVLGLTPTILVMLGCGTAELALLSKRRPLLSICLALGSPALTPIRTYEYDDVFEILETKDGLPQHSKESRARKVFLVAAQYLVALGAIVNVATVSYELGTKALFNYACNNDYLALLWAFIAALVQLHGWIAFHLRFKLVDFDPDDKRHKHNCFSRWLRTEFLPCSTLGPGVIHSKSPTIFFHVFCWYTSALAVLHILFGTLTFSSLTFISVIDALPVAARYIVSAIFCRGILMYELSGMRETVSMQLATVIQDDAVSLRSIIRGHRAPAERERESEFSPLRGNEA